METTLDPRLFHPFSCVVAGPSGSGKTEFVIELLNNCDEMITPPPQRIVWCFGEYQRAFDRLPRNRVEFCEGRPNLKEFDGRQRVLLVIDDLMAESADSKEMSNLFTKGSHHKDVSVVFITQNLFYRGKETRTINLNAHYIVLFKNPRDATQIVHLGRQMFPGSSKYVQEAYADATSRPYGYLFIDLKSTTSDVLRLRTNVLPEEQTFVYVKKV